MSGVLPSEKPDCSQPEGRQINSKSTLYTMPCTLIHVPWLQWLQGGGVGLLPTSEVGGVRFHNQLLAPCQHWKPSVFRLVKLSDCLRRIWDVFPAEQHWAAPSPAWDMTQQSWQRVSFGPFGLEPVSGLEFRNTASAAKAGVASCKQ